MLSVLFFVPREPVGDVRYHHDEHPPSPALRRAHPWQPYAALMSSTTEAVAALAPRYDEPWRGYHTREHVAEVLAALRFLTGTPLHPSLELAAWAHDAVYDPRAAAGDNERASAELARDVLDGAGVPAGITEEVVDLTLATITHTPTSDPNDAERVARTEAFLDADLWILSAPPERFARYEDQVRREYAFVPDDRFAEGRAAILAEFARRERIYLTGRAREAWEPSARRNLARIGHHGEPPHRDSSSSPPNQPSS